MFKNHLDMIGRNEPIQRKAKFWQSYVRSLKGTDDMRAPESTSTRPRSVFRPFLDFPEVSTSSWPYGKSIYDEPSHPVDRIHVPGYRYLPISRETYGISPRPIHPPSVYDRYRSASPSPYKGQDAWDAHQARLAAIDKLLPDKYIPLYSYRPIARSLSPPPRPRSASPFRSRSTSPPPPHRSWTPPPTTASERAVRLNHVGQPVYHRPGWGGYTRRPLSELLDPLPTMPKSFITRDPWWWEYPELRPYTSGYYSWPRSPYYLRNSYLSPIKSTYLWDRHPRRPFGYLTYW